MDKLMGLKIEKPNRIWERSVKVDWREQVEALGRDGGTVTTVADDSAPNEALSGLLAGLGFEVREPAELAWLLIYRALLRALYTIGSKNPQVLCALPDDPKVFAETLELHRLLSDISIDRNFFDNPSALPVLAQVKLAFSQWLSGHGLNKVFAEEFPRQFHQSLNAEWMQHPDKYKPLQEELSSPFSPPPQFEELRKIYLRYLRETYEYLELNDIPAFVRSVGKGGSVKIEDIYVPRQARWERTPGETWDPRSSLSDFVDVEDALTSMPALVLLGDPGSGKSTLLKHLALALATAEDGMLLPIVLPLSAYSEALRHGPIPLRSFLSEYFASRQDRLKELAPLFEHYIRWGRAVVLLDGLDEVRCDRVKLVGCIDEFVREFTPVPTRIKDKVAHLGNSVVVTSRFVGYRDAPLKDRRWSILLLQNWSGNKIKRFINRWTIAIELAMKDGRDNDTVMSKARVDRDALVAAVFYSENTLHLAGNPLLLTLLALIKHQGVALPHSRVELCEIFLRTLLESWAYARNLDQNPIGPRGDYISLVQVLAPLALWLREENPEDGYIHRKRLIDYLEGYYARQRGLDQSPSKAAREFLESVQRYSTLLLEKGPDRFGFIHLSFEEYLAGKGLTRLKPEEAVAKIINHVSDDDWRDTILLSIGALGLVNQRPEQAGNLLESLLKAPISGNKRIASVFLAADALRDLGVDGIGKHCADTVIHNLVETMQKSENDPGDRRQAGVLLGDLGWRPDDLDAFFEVPAGTFLYGEDRHEETISSRYWIAKYPVTNAQYDSFIKAGGYEERKYWDDVAWSWRSRNDIYGPRFWDDPQRNSPIFPVVGVSWYEATAYCRWLDAHLRKQGLKTVVGPLSFPKGCVVALPTEHEWERAARGIDGRTYPWGETFNPTNLNSYQSSINMTTPVSTFPRGESPVGVWDACGNVYEWTRGGSKVARVMRGGSYHNLRDHVRCVSRSRYPPEGRYDGLGFRVVVTPNLSER